MTAPRPSCDRADRLMIEAIDRALTVEEQAWLSHHVGGCQRCSRTEASAESGRLAAESVASPGPSPTSTTRALRAFAGAQEAASTASGPTPDKFAECRRLSDVAREATFSNPAEEAEAALAAGALSNVDRLCSQSHDATFDNPARAVELAEEALELARSLKTAVAGAALVADCQSRAWGAIGNARRVVSDLRGAEAALAQAQALLVSGTGDPLVRARIDYYVGGLRNAQRRFPEAIACYDRALATHRLHGQMHEAARATIAKAVTVSETDPNESIRLHREALPLIDGAREPRLMLAAKHNLAVDLLNTGRVEEAATITRELRPAYERLGQRILLIRLRWVEAQVAHARGDVVLAERAYLDAIAGFEAHAMPYAIAVASLELSTMYGEQGRPAEIKKLARGMIPVFQALEIQRETIAALMLFRQAAEAESATLALIQHIAAFVKRAQHDPAATFAPPN